MTTQVTPVQKSNDTEQALGLLQLGMNAYGAFGKKKEDKESSSTSGSNPRDRTMYKIQMGGSK